MNSLKIDRFAFAFAVLVLLAGAGESRAQDTERQVDKVGTTAAPFLNMPVGARATAMGSAFSAVVNDATAMYWNPAGLAGPTEISFVGEYATWLADIEFSFVGIALPTSFGTVGLSITSLRSPEMEVTEENVPGYYTGETFRASSYAVGVSYGRALTDRFALGGTAKLIRESISFSSATGVALDIGTMFTTPFRGVRLGAAITNFGTKMRMAGDDLRVQLPGSVNDGNGSDDATGVFETDAYDLPLNMRIGLAGEVLETANSRMTLAIDAYHPNDNGEYVNVGAEIALLGELLLFRGGYNELFLDESERSYALGAGLNYGFGALDFRVDYAFEAHRYFNNVNRLTLFLQF